MKKIWKAFGATLALVGLVGVASVANAQPASAACVDYNYSYSLTTKTCVTYIQRLVNSLKTGNTGVVSNYLTVDGKYGWKTVNAVQEVQSRGYTNLGNLAVDGITGKQTWAVLCTFGGGYDRTAYNNAGCGYSWKYGITTVGLR